MSDVLEQCLADLEARIDERQEQQHLEAWLKFLAGRHSGKFFTAPPRRPAPPRVQWPKITINQALVDPQAMLLHQFGQASDVLASGGDQCLNVRCNYGIGILPSLFGCPVVMIDESLDTLPTCRAIGRDGAKAALDVGVPDIRGGLGRKVFETAERFLEALARHPVLARRVWFYHPDAQGPIDIAEVVWGSDIFYAFYDNAPLLRDFLAVVTDTYAAFMRAWYALAPQTTDYSAHWGWMYPGRLMLRDDSLMNLSPRAYAEFIRPHDQRLLEEFGGGCVHFCGRCEHYIAELSQLRGLTAIQMSQPELNNMETVFRHTIDKGILMIGLARQAAESAGRPLRGRVHGMG